MIDGKPTCAECKRMVECCRDYGVCDYELNMAFFEEFGFYQKQNAAAGATWALEWIPNHMRDMQGVACDHFHK